MAILRQNTAPTPTTPIQGTVTAIPKTVSLNELFDIQTEIKHLEDAIKMKKSEFAQKCGDVYPFSESSIHKDGTGYELHWIEKKTRSVIMDKLKQDNPSTYNMAAKETIAPADLERMMGEEAADYFFTKFTYIPMVVLTIHT